MLPNPSGPPEPRNPVRQSFHHHPALRGFYTWPTCQWCIAYNLPKKLAGNIKITADYTMTMHTTCNLVIILLKWNGLLIIRVTANKSLLPPDSVLPFFCGSVSCLKNSNMSFRILSYTYLQINKYDYTNYRKKFCNFASNPRIKHLSKVYQEINNY